MRAAATSCSHRWDTRAPVWQSAAQHHDSQANRQTMDVKSARLLGLESADERLSELRELPAVLELELLKELKLRSLRGLSLPRLKPFRAAFCEGLGPSAARLPGSAAPLPPA